MAFSLSDFFFGMGRGAAQRALQQGEQFAYVGANPFQEQQNALIEMLMANARGENSLAAQQYKGAMGDAMAQQFAMSRGRGAGAARGAQEQLGAIGTQLAGGVAEATLKERLGAQSQLQGALTAAHQADFQRAMANQQMYQQALAMMANQGGIGQQLLGMAGQGLGAYAMMRGPGGGQQPNPMEAFAQALGVGGQSVGQVGRAVGGAMGGSPGPKDPWA